MGFQFKQCTSVEILVPNSADPQYKLSVEFISPIVLVPMAVYGAIQSYVHILRPTKDTIF